MERDPDLTRKMLKLIEEETGIAERPVALDGKRHFPNHSPEKVMKHAESLRQNGMFEVQNVVEGAAPLPTTIFVDGLSSIGESKLEELS